MKKSFVFLMAVLLLVSTRITPVYADASIYWKSDAWGDTDESSFDDIYFDFGYDVPASEDYLPGSSDTVTEPPPPEYVTTRPPTRRPTNTPTPTPTSTPAPTPTVPPPALRPPVTLSPVTQPPMGDQQEYLPPITKPLTSVPDLLPDLVLEVEWWHTQIGFTGGIPVFGINLYDGIYFDITLYNEGTADIGKDAVINYALRIDGIQIEEMDWSIPVDAGTGAAGYIQTIAWGTHSSLSPGEHIVTVTVDDDNRFKELDETNNTITAIFRAEDVQIVQPYNLNVSGIHIEMSDEEQAYFDRTGVLMPGVTVGLSYYHENELFNNNGNDILTYVVAWYIDGNLLGSYSSTAGSDVMVAWTPPVERINTPYYITCKVDPGDYISEIYENDNELTVYVYAAEIVTIGN